jgi:class 3 adenylate cyclase/tetratricopeptide (TPR) repeat protein
MRCQACGLDNRPGRKFCAQCAAPLVVACAQCGASNEPGERYCGECAAPLDDSAAASPPVVSGGQAVAPAESQAPVAERRVVSVLFADLVGFTQHSEGTDPELVRDLLSRYFETTQQIIRRYGGEVEKFIGDAVMAVWGTPTAHEDDAERAVRAALELVEAVAALDAGPGMDRLAARAAVLTGEAAVTIGATGQGMVAGDLVNTASRLQSVAPTGSVLVDETTRRAASGAILFEPAGEHTLKGKGAPVVAWRADRVVAMIGGVGRTEQLEPPFVGREAELRLLKEMLHTTAAERRARLVSVIGGAGMGKSRLGWEFHKYIDGLVENIYWHQGRSPAYGEGVTFWALGEMVRKRAGLAETDDESVTRARVAATLKEYVADVDERRWMEPRLLQLFGLESEVTSEREELFAAWRTLFERVAELGPTVLLFEDLHWADPGLIDFIEHVLERSRAYPLLIITMARPELFTRRPDWGSGQRNFVGITLEPLAADALTEGIEGLVPGLPGETVRAIVARAEGIPLYAVETVRMLLQKGQIVEQDGVFRPVGDLTDLDVPESLHALIAARIDTLAAPDRQLMTEATVLGLTFTIEALAALAGDSADVLRPRLRGLVQREMLSLNEDPRSPERGQYSFVHRLTHEVAYARLSRIDRRRLHLSAARYFETLEDEEIAGALAMHYLDAYRAAPEGPEGEAVAIQARIALRAAADRAISLHSYEQALSFLEHALTVTSSDADRAAILERAAGAAQALARFTDAERHVRASIEHYRAAGDNPGVTRAMATLGNVLSVSGRPEAALGLLEPVLADLPEQGADPAVVTLLASIARAYALSDRAGPALEYADRALVLAERMDLVSLIADAVTTKGVALSATGRTREAAILMEGVLRLAEEEGLRTAELRAQMNISMYRYPDDPRSGLAAARAGAERARRFGSVEWQVLLESNAAMCALPVGEWDWIVELARSETLRSALTGGAEEALGAAAVVHAFRGEVAEADALMAELEPLIATSSDPQDRAIANAYQAGVDLAAGRYDRALAQGEAIDRNVGLDVTVAYRTLGMAAHAAVAMGSLERAAALLDKLVDLAIHGRWARATKLTISAGVAALSGSVAEATAVYAEALRAWRALDLPFDLLMCQVEMVERLGGGSEEARAAAAEAREIATALRAVALLERLDAAAVHAAPAPPATTAQGRAVYRSEAIHADS